MLYFQVLTPMSITLSPRRWGKSHLVLRSVVACSGENKVKRYEGALPYGLDWEDTRTQTRDKLRTGEPVYCTPVGVTAGGKLTAIPLSITNQANLAGPETPGIFEVIQAFYRRAPNVNEDSYPDAAACGPARQAYPFS